MPWFMMAGSDSDSGSPADSSSRGVSPDGSASSDSEGDSPHAIGTTGPEAAETGSEEDSDESGLSDLASAPAAVTATSSGSEVEDKSAASDSSSDPAAATAAGSESEADSSSGSSSSSSSSPTASPFCLWELCCAPDSELVAAVRKRGGEGQRLTLETGFDMQSKKATQRAQQRITSSHKFPRAWASPPCTKWSAIQNLTKSTPARAKALKQARQRSRALVANCVAVLITVLRKGGHFYYECPHHCQGWHIPELLHLRRQTRRAGQQVFEVLFEGCAFGLQDTTGEFFLRKRWRILTNDPELASVARRCPFQGRDAPGHVHTTIQGKETARSAFYPPQMCRALAQHWRQHLCSVQSIERRRPRG